MSTRGSIARQNVDGSITAIYVHFDSYLAGVGHTLVNHYQDPIKIEQLMQLGDLSSLGADIGALRTSDRDSRYRYWCTAYGRDRGETGCEAKHYVNVSSWLDELGQEYNYLWDGAEWLVECSLTKHEFRSVTQMLLEKS
jgi:hypothetical protein